MDILNHIGLGLLMVGIGTVTLKYNFQMVGIVGNIGFFEKYIGAGGTYFGFKLISVFLVLFGILYATGLGDPILRWALSPLAIFFSGPKK